MADDPELLAQYEALFPAERPSTEAEKEAAQALSAERKAFVAAEAKKRGYEKAGKLQKELDKALNKLIKKRQAAAAPPPAAPAGAGAAPAAEAAAAATENEQAQEQEQQEDDLDEQMRRTLGSPAENEGRGAYYVNSNEVLQKHLEATGGKWQLRFPPEPNGWLHIGHAKAMSINFGIAAANDGNCYLRFDDTNPTAEKQEYIDGILENVAWLGHTPFKVTHTSDYFDELYELACELVRRGKAYVCFLDGAGIKAQRNALIAYHREVAAARDAGAEPPAFPAEAVADPSRERSPEENLKLFEDMKNGVFKEGECTLRMKCDFNSPNPNMWDHMAYRIMYAAHPRTGDKWCIYPTYDFSHCLVDSLENVTHSLCTLEFETRQAADSSYHWLLHALDMYHPKTWESSRCSLSYNVMSKRRLNQLVTEGFVSGWDDPRLLTLAGLRRRGYTPAAINAFCRRVGIARSSNEVCVRISVLESCIRAELDRDAPRRLAVMDPLKLVITNYDDPEAEAPAAVTVPNHPAKDRGDMGSRQVPFTREIYIPREKFRLEMIKGYKGLVPGAPKNNSIRLLNAAVVAYESHDVDAEGNVTEVRVRIDRGETRKGLSVVSWVPSSALRVEARIYDRLFNDCEIDGSEVHAEKAAKDKGVDFVALFNSDSLRKDTILVEPGLQAELGQGLRWQFITVGYFCEDRVDSTPEAPVLNLIVTLREDKTKAAAAT